MKLIFIIVVIVIALAFLAYAVWTAPLWDDENNTWIRGRKNQRDYMNKRNEKQVL